MTTGQTIETKIVVDAKQATAEVDKFNGRLSAISELATRPIGSLKDLQDGAQKLQQKLAPTAAAISGVASALGQAGGEAGKVVAGVGQMAAAFGAGGPWAVAIVGGTMLLDEYLAAQKEIEQNAEIARNAFARFGDTMTNNTNKATQELAEKLKKAREEIENFGKSAIEVDIKLAKAEIARTEARMKGAEDVVARAKERSERIKAEMNDLALLQREAEANGTSIRMQVIERLKLYTDELVVIKKATEAQESMTIKLKEQQDTTRGLIQASKELAGKKGTGGTGGMGGARGGARIGQEEEIDSTVAMLLYVNQLKEKANAEYLSAKKSADEQERRDFENSEKAKTKIVEEEAKRRKEAEEKAAEEKANAIKAIEQKQSDFVSGIQQAALSQLLSTGQAYIDAKIKGEKDAEQKAVASFLSATGQQLVASGTRAIFEGFIANAALPGSGMPLIGMGTAAIAAGVGMGAAGSAMAPPPEAKGTGGAARDRGAAPRSSRGSGDGGPLVINVSYGVGGPLPEDTAREIARVMRTGNRRRGAA